MTKAERKAMEEARRASAKTTGVRRGTVIAASAELGQLSDLRDPETRAVYDRWKRERGIPTASPLSVPERREFERYLTESKKKTTAV